MTPNKQCQIFFIDPDIAWLNFAKSALVSISKEPKANVHSSTHIEDLLSLQKPSTQITRIAFIDLEFAEKEPLLVKKIANIKDLYIIVLFPMDFLPYRISNIFKLGVHDCFEKPYDAQSLMNIYNELKDEIQHHQQYTNSSFNSLAFSRC